MDGAKVRGEDVIDECSVISYYYNALIYDFKICKDPYLHINTYNVILRRSYPPGIK